jgi:galactosamine-6-phosphate isomerase
MYRLLAEDPEFRPGQLRALGLDEWHGLPRDHPATCRYFLQQEVFVPWGIAPARQFTFQADAPDPAAECRRMAEILDREGPMDLCILGLGRNGHLGLNEPADALCPHAHVAELAPLSRSHRMLADQAVRVEKGMTFGMQDLLDARRILLLVTGSGKQEVCHELLHGEVRPAIPATYLRTHDNVDVLLDQSSLHPPKSP